MIIQIANIVSGTLLATPKIAEWGQKDAAQKIEQTLAPYALWIGGAELILGLLALVERMGIIHVPIPEFGASYPQAIPAILVGLILCAGYLKQFKVLDDLIGKLQPYKEWLGVVAFIAELNSILFGCWLCMY